MKHLKSYNQVNEELTRNQRMILRVIKLFKHSKSNLFYPQTQIVGNIFLPQ